MSVCMCVLQSFITRRGSVAGPGATAFEASNTELGRRNSAGRATPLQSGDQWQCQWPVLSPETRHQPRQGTWQKSTKQGLESISVIPGLASKYVGRHGGECDKRETRHHARLQHGATVHHGPCSMHSCTFACRELTRRTTAGTLPKAASC